MIYSLEVAINPMHHKKKVNHAHLTTTVHIKPIGARALTKHRFGWRS